MLSHAKTLIWKSRHANLMICLFLMVAIVFAVVKSNDWAQRRRLIEYSGVILIEHPQSFAMSYNAPLIAVGGADEPPGQWRSAPNLQLLRLVETDSSLTLDRVSTGNVVALTNVYSIAISPDETQISLGGNQPYVLVTDTKNNSAPQELIGHGLVDDEPGKARRVVMPYYVLALAYSPNGEYLASGAEDGRVIVWKSESKEMTKKVDIGREWVTCLSFSPDGKQLAVGTYDGYIMVMDFPACTSLRRVFKHRHTVSCLSFSPDGKKLASAASIDSKIVISDLELGTAIEFYNSTRGVRSVCYCPSGEQVVTGDAYGYLSFWDPLSGKKLGSIDAHNGWVVGLSMYRDHIISVGGDKRIFIWKIPMGRVLD